MNYIVSITSQGQISIPAKIRKDLGLNKSRRAVVAQVGDKIVVEPVRDLLDQRGSLKTSINATPQQIRKAFETYLSKETTKSKK